MGQSLNAMHEEAQKQNTYDEKMCRDSLNLLMATCNGKLDAFKLQTLDDHSNEFVPINKVLRTSRFIHASVEEDSQMLTDTVSSIINQVADEQYGKALISFASFAIKTLFGNCSGNESEFTDYKIVVGPIGGVYRLDFFMYSYKFTSDKLISLTKNVVATSLFHSSVKIDSLDDNTMRDIVQLCYGSFCTTEELQKLYETMKQQTVPSSARGGISKSIALPNPSTPSEKRGKKRKPDEEVENRESESE